MMAADPAIPDDVAALTEVLAVTTPRLHGIVSRTDPVQIAAEVLRLNDAVRAAAAGRLRSGDQPQDFAAMLLAHADPANADPAAAATAATPAAGAGGTQ